jgi:steroid delta-isomerase-like uncharacterized protein
MSIKENKALIRRVYELWNKKELAEYFKLLAPEFIGHFTEMDTNMEQQKEVDIGFFNAFPDAISNIEDMVAERDRVAVRVTWRGTHKGEFMGVPATGKKFEITGAAIYRITNDKLAEVWAITDSLHFMQQLGVIPKP